MRKNIFIIIFASIVALCFLNIGKTNAEENKCADGYIKKSATLCYSNDKLCCYNPETHLSYNEKNSFFMGDGRSNKGTYSCGSECNYDGTGCKSGVCNVKDCNIGYTEMKYGRCYNPASHLSYDEFDNFYLDDDNLYDKYFQCGDKCNPDGTNCKKGFCNVKSCAKGYTEIYHSMRLLDGWDVYGVCYNPETHLSYTWSNRFKLSNVYCGKNCNPDGTNCKIGNCNEKEIRAHGYTEIKESQSAYDQYKFYNPKTHLAYYVSDSNYNIFYLNDAKCGNSCDWDGANCKEGFCNAKDCENGYTETKNGNCYNPVTRLSYDTKNTFYLDGVKCGDKCKPDGTNCETGICNANDCKDGYKNLAVMRKAYFENADIIGYSGGSYDIVACINNPTTPTRYYDVSDKSEKTKSLIAEVPKRAFAGPAAVLGTIGEILYIIFIVPISLVISIFQ